MKKNTIVIFFKCVGYTHESSFRDRLLAACVSAMQAIPQVEDIETGVVSNAEHVSDDSTRPRTTAYRQCGAAKAYCVAALALTAGFVMLSIWRHWNDDTPLECVGCYGTCDHACSDCYCMAVTDDVHNGLLNKTLSVRNVPYTLRTLRPDTQNNECASDAEFPCGL